MNRSGHSRRKTRQQGRRVVRVLLTVLVFCAGLSSGVAQTLDPSSPAKENVYLNRRLMVVERTGAGLAGGTGPGAMRQLNMTASRAVNTVYQNTTGHALLVMISFGPMGTGLNAAYADANMPPTTMVARISTNNTWGVTLCFIVQAGHYYKVTSANGFSSFTWLEYELLNGAITDSGSLGGSRALGSVYQNTSSVPTFVAVQLSGASGSMLAYSNSASPPTTMTFGTSVGGGSDLFAFFLVLPGEYYKVTGTGTLTDWHEYSWSVVSITRAALTGRPATSSQSYVNASGKTKWVQIVNHAGATSTCFFRSDDFSVPPITSVEFHSAVGGQYRSGYGPVPVGGFYLLYGDGGITIDSWLEYTIAP